MANLKQPSLFPASWKTEVYLKEDHELIQITELIDWDELILLAMNCRSAKVKKEVGPQPRYRELLGAVVLMSLKGFDYRQAEDMIAHYAPARYLCDLMDSTWQPDHVTIFDFTKMLGPEGMSSINKTILKQAQGLGFLDSTELMSDTTAQEAKIPYPTEVGLMSDFVNKVKKNLSKTGKAFRGVKEKIKEVAKKVKGMVRSYHLFCKSKEEKAKTAKKMFYTIEEVQNELTSVFQDFKSRGSKASEELQRLQEVMSTLMPQIKHFIDTGFVASKKIIHLNMPELYSIVRGKAGKKTEFGLKWGISRIGGGFVNGFLMNEAKHASDVQFCKDAVTEHMKIFGEAPEMYGFDRGGYSKANVKKIEKLGVKHVGVAPKGKTEWSVSKKRENYIKRERAQVEGVIGTVKTQNYGFNKPNARSVSAMESCGHRSIIAFNLRKMMKINQTLLPQEI